MKRQMQVDPDVTEFLAALASETRQSLLLSFMDGKERTVGDLVLSSKLKQSTVSAHLAQLHRSGVLSRRKDGKEVYYRPDRIRIAELLSRFAAYLRGCC